MSSSRFLMASSRDLTPSAASLTTLSNSCLSLRRSRSTIYASDSCESLAELLASNDEGGWMLPMPAPSLPIPMLDVPIEGG